MDNLGEEEIFYVSHPSIYFSLHTRDDTASSVRAESRTTIAESSQPAVTAEVPNEMYGQRLSQPTLHSRPAEAVAFPTGSAQYPQRTEGNCSKAGYVGLVPLCLL